MSSAASDVYKRQTLLGMVEDGGKMERIIGRHCWAGLVLYWVVREGFTKGHVRKSRLGEGKAFQSEGWQM